MKPISDEELSRLLAEPPVTDLPTDFAARVSHRMLALHRRRKNTRLSVQLLVYLVLAPGLILGLGVFVSKEAAATLVGALLAYKWVLLFCAALFMLIQVLDGRLFESRSRSV